MKSIKNLLDETISVLNKYNLTLNDVVVVFNGEILDSIGKIDEKLDVNYDNGYGHLIFGDIQLIVDDYTWFERTSYDVKEKYILKSHPLLSNYENSEFHPCS